MATARHHRIFGRTKSQHTIIIARGDEVRHFTVRFPWLWATAAMGLVAGGALLAVDTTSHIGSAVADNGAAAAYELRIASLRSQVEQLTTRGFIDQEQVSNKVDTLLDQQTQLTERYTKLETLLARAKSSGLLKGGVPTPQPRPEGKSAPVSGGPAQALSFAGAETSSTLDRFRLVDRASAATAAPESSSISPDLLRQIARSMEEVEADQIESVAALTAEARSKSDAIGSVLRTEGIRTALPRPAGDAGEGGPFVPVPTGQRFEARLADLATALDVLQSTREAMSALPIAAPVSSTVVSSPFGVRADPFFDRAAMHTGMDFVAEPGSAVQAAAGGKVTFAGSNGAYGNMVEVDHGNGLATRYAHMSSIVVKVGQTLKAGAVVGRVGSTGRSTGPHLHYELRRSGEPVDPARYLRAGRRISALG